MQAHKAAGAEALAGDAPGLQSKESGGNGEGHFWRGGRRCDFAPEARGRSERSCKFCIVERVFRLLGVPGRRKGQRRLEGGCLNEEPEQVTRAETGRRRQMQRWAGVESTGLGALLGQQRRLQTSAWAEAPLAEQIPVSRSRGHTTASTSVKFAFQVPVGLTSDLH